VVKAGAVQEEKGDWIKFQTVTIQRYFPVVLFVMLCEVVLILEPVEIPKYDHSLKEVFRGAVYYSLRCGFPLLNIWK